MLEILSFWSHFGKPRLFIVARAISASALVRKKVISVNKSIESSIKYPFCSLEEVVEVSGRWTRVAIPWRIPAHQWEGVRTETLKWNRNQFHRFLKCLGSQKDHNAKAEWNGNSLKDFVPIMLALTSSWGSMSVVAVPRAPGISNTACWDQGSHNFSCCNCIFLPLQCLFDKERCTFGPLPRLTTCMERPSTETLTLFREEDMCLMLRIYTKACNRGKRKTGGGS